MVKYLQLGQSALIALTSQNTDESFNVAMEPGTPTACSAEPRDSSGQLVIASCFWRMRSQKRICFEYTLHHELDIKSPEYRVCSVFSVKVFVQDSRSFIL